MSRRLRQNGPGFRSRGEIRSPSVDEWRFIEPEIDVAPEPESERETRVASQIREIQSLLARKMTDRCFTKIEVEEALGWKSVTVCRLLSREKELRVEHMLEILGVINVAPEEFFAELYATPPV